MTFDKTKNLPTLEHGTYQHYKGNRYTLIGIAHHSETLEPMVVYQAQYDTQDFGPKPIWVRPLALFTDTITIDGKEVPRFKKVQ